MFMLARGLINLNMMKADLIYLDTSQAVTILIKRRIIHTLMLHNIIIQMKNYTGGTLLNRFN